MEAGREGVEGLMEAEVGEKFRDYDFREEN